MLEMLSLAKLSIGKRLRLRIALLPAACALLAAVEPAWKTNPVAQWTTEDALHLLAASPWVKQAVPVLLPRLTPEQRRQGGATGGGKDSGLKTLGIGGGSDTSVQPSRQIQGGALTIRWESAFPVRAAELKAQDLGAPDWEGDAYVLAVYGVPGLKFDHNQKSLEGELKAAAFLKREGKKDLKPSSVQLMQARNGLAVVVYLFPRSNEISTEDQRVEFVAQIDRLSLAQYFYPAEMEFEGKLQL